MTMTSELRELTCEERKVARDPDALTRAPWPQGKENQPCDHRCEESKKPLATVDPSPQRRFLQVMFLNGSPRWYELDEHGWRLDVMSRELVIGKGLGRQHIPLDNVEYYRPE